LIPYLEKTYKNFRYLGTDLSSGMIEEAKKENPSYSFQILDMTDLDTLSTKFDIAFFIASFHHLDSAEARLNTFNKLKNLLNTD
jgi:trans-aconitate methyltransferase